MIMYGECTMTDKKVMRIEDELYGGYTVVENPVSDYWDIELCLYHDSHAQYLFLVKFTSKMPIELPDGQVIVQSKWIKEVDFEDKERTIRKELRTIGMVNDLIFRGIKDYIEYLKFNKKYTFYGELIQSVEMVGDEPKYSSFDSETCYEVLIKEVVENRRFFPISTSDYEVGVSYGILISNYKKQEFTAVALEGHRLQDIIQVVGKAEFEDVIRSWREQGLLVSGDKKANRLTTKFTFCTNYRTNAYIIKLEHDMMEKLVTIA